MDAVAQSIGFIGPVFSIAFLVPLLVGLNASGKGAGAAAPLSVLLAAIGVLGLGWIVAAVRQAHPRGRLALRLRDRRARARGSAAPPGCSTTSASSCSARSSWS